jgi:hypothetical protein
MSSMKWMIVPLIIGENGKLIQSLIKYLEAIPEKYSIDALQRVIL